MPNSIQTPLTEQKVPFGSEEFKPKRGFRTWASTLWPLILHLVGVIGILALMICYVDERHFNLTERRPRVPLANGTTVRLSQYVPLQSDVTTFLSSALVTLRMVTAAWAGSLCWRSAFFLMEKIGLGYRDLDWMIGYGVLTPTIYDKHLLRFRISFILFAVISAQSSSPILTGSIAWLPSSQPVALQSNPALDVAVTAEGREGLWNEYMQAVERREWTARQAAGLASVAWGRDVERDVMKRVLPSAAGLNINSTVANVTLPYFLVASLEWIPNPLSIAPDQRDMTKIMASLSAFGDPKPLLPGTAVLIPNAPWQVIAPPSPSVTSETRMLVLTVDWPSGSCQPDNLQIFSPLPLGINLLEDRGACYAFAWVTYAAGAGVCLDCRVSSYSTVQSNIRPSVQPDFATAEALRLMPDTTALLVLLNSSIPSPRGDIDDYVVGLLSRSYSGAWTALTHRFGLFSVPLTSRYSASLPYLQARVDNKRVYAWAAIQLLVTLSGLTFLFMQSGTKYRLLGGTTLTAFKLETTEVTGPVGRGQLKGGELLELKSNAGGLKVVFKRSASSFHDDSESSKPLDSGTGAA